MPEDKGAYEKHFYFFSVKISDVKVSPCGFNYQIRSGRLESKLYVFSSQLYCSDFIRIISIGQHDNSKIGMRLTDSAKHLSIDLLIFNGNYATNMHLSNGQLGEEYFASIEVLMSKSVTLIFPGRRENFDNYKMFQSRFMMPGCFDDPYCSVSRFYDKKVDILWINFEKILNENLSAEEWQKESKDLQEKIQTTFHQIEKETSKDEDAIMKFVFSNADFYCSMYDPTNSCLADLFILKPFEDLFAKFGVNLVVSSGRKMYQAIRNVYNLELLQSGRPRNYVVNGMGGCANFYSVNPIKFSPQLSFKSVTEVQGVLSVDVFDGYYKLDMLEVPNYTSFDLRFIRMDFDCEKLLFFIIFSIALVVLLLFLEKVNGKKLGTKFAVWMSREKHQLKNENTNENVNTQLTG